MRHLLIAAATLLGLAACATQEPVKTAAAPTAEKKAPQCYSGDHGKFFNVGETATIAGVTVVCEKTSDGKNGQWMGKKH